MTQLRHLLGEFPAVKYGVHIGVSGVKNVDTIPASSFGWRVQKWISYMCVQYGYRVKYRGASTLTLSYMLQVLNLN